MRIYLIHPVRNVSEEILLMVTEHVKALEDAGHEVHFPSRDVDQNDPTGLAICEAHREKMEWCDEVHIVWDKNSKGSHFDLGMAWALHKPWKLVWAVHPDNPEKSYLKVIQAA